MWEVPSIGNKKRRIYLKILVIALNGVIVIRISILKLELLYMAHYNEVAPTHVLPYLRFKISNRAMHI